MATATLASSTPSGSYTTINKWLAEQHSMPSNPPKTPRPGELLLAFDNIQVLKGLAHAKIIKKSVILFRVLNMTIWCKHVHRLELQIFIIFVLRIHQLDWI